MVKVTERDNNFAVSTLDLAQGIQKSASTAKTFGVELDTLVGYIAAIGSTTRESGTIIGNGLKTIFSRITTMSEVEDILNSVNVQVKDMQGNVRPVQDIIADLANVWGSLSEKQQQNIGVTIAGRYQLSRFLALLNNFSLAQDATSTSINSVGSAMREQEKYADSLEGRLNRLDTAWNKLTISTGNAFLTDGIIATVEVLNDLATGLSGIIDTFGALSVIFGTVGVATLLLSTRFRTLVTSILFTPKAVEATKAAMIGLTTSMTRAEVATVTLKTALRGLLSATVVGAVFAAVGIAIEKLVSAISNAKQAQEEFEQSQQKSVDALTKNKEETEELINKYKELSQAKENGNWDTTKEQEYLQIQQQLGEVFPQLVDSVDQQGQYHLKNAELIDKEIEATKKLIDLKREEIRLNAEDKFAENIDERDGYFGLDKKIERRKENIAALKSLHAEQEEINKAEQELLALENQRASNLQELAYEVMEVANAYNNINIDPNISKQIENFILSLDLSKLDASELESFSIQVSKIMKSLQESFDSGDESKFQSTVDSFNNLIEKMGLSDDKTNSLKISYEQAKNASEQLKDATYDTDGALEDYANSAENAANKTDELVEAYNNATSNIKSLNGVINELNEGNGLSADSIGILLEKYPYLLAYINDETALRQAVQQEINNEANVAMQAMQQKLMADQNYIKTSKVLNSDFRQWLIKTYGIDLANYKDLAEAKAAVDNQLIKTLGKNWSKYYTILGNGMAQIGGVAGDNLVRGAMQGDKEANKKLNALYSKMQSYNNIAKQVAAGFDSITLTPVNVGGSLKKIGLNQPKSSGRSSSRGSRGSGGSKGSSATETAREIERATSSISEYDRVMNDLNDQLEESNIRMKNLDKTSQAYRNELQNQIAIYSRQKAINENEARLYRQRINSLKAQLASMGDFNRLSDENKEKYNEIVKTIDDYTQTLWKMEDAVRDNASSIQEANEKIKESYEGIANQVIDVYKKLIEVQRDESIKAIEDEMDAFEKAHNRKLKLLDKEMSAYEEIIDAQKKALQKQKDEEDYDKQMAKYNTEFQDLQSQYNKWSRDDSAYGKQRAKEIAKEMEELQEEIAEYQRDRQYELQQNSLDQLLENKQKQIANEKELENQSYETGKERLEREKSDLEQYYEDLLNDERAFNEMKQQILANQISGINNQLKTFTRYVQDNMQSIGQSISENLIDKIAEAQTLLTGISGGFSSGGSSSNLISFLNALKQNGFDEGGYVPYNGFTYVHGGERVLDKEDNKNFERTMSFLDKAKSWMNVIIKQPAVPTLSTTNNANSITIAMPITIESMNGTRQDAENVFRTIGNKLTQSGILPKIK